MGSIFNNFKYHLHLNIIHISITKEEKKHIETDSNKVD